VGHHSNGSGSALLGLDGLEVVSAELMGGEWQLAVQTMATLVGCVSCGVRATRLPELHQLPAAAAIALRSRLADAPDLKAARPSAYHQPNSRVMSIVSVKGLPKRATSLSVALIGVVTRQLRYLAYRRAASGGG
jgi:hypothetical protein